MQGCERDSFSDRLGTWGIARVVWCAIPWQWRLFSFPYSFYVYRRLLAVSKNMDDLRANHGLHWHDHTVFRLFRPRFHIMKRALLTLNTKSVEKVVHKAPTKDLSTAQVSDRQRSTTQSKVSV